jgi:hypothetical protein
MDVPAQTALGADEAGTEAMARGAGTICGIGPCRFPFRRAAARSLPSVAAPTLTHSPGLLSPPGGEWRAV